MKKYKEELDLSAIDEDMKQETSKNIKKSKFKGFVKGKILPAVASLLVLTSLTAPLGGAVAYKISKGEMEIVMNERGLLKGSRTYLPVKNLSSIKQMLEGFDVVLPSINNDISVMQVQRSGIEMRIRQDLYDEHKQEFDYVCDYYNSIFSIINPDIKFFINTTKGEPSLANGVIAYTQVGVKEKERLGEAVSFNASENIFIGTFDEDKAENVPNIKYSYISYGAGVNNDGYFFRPSSNNPFCFINITLHETDHCLYSIGNDHIEHSDGGNIMVPNGPNTTPLCYSPTELARLIAVYGSEDKIDFYNEFLDWYTEKYNELEARFLSEYNINDCLYYNALSEEKQMGLFENIDVNEFLLEQSAENIK